MPRRSVGCWRHWHRRGLFEVKSERITIHPVSRGDFPAIKHYGLVPNKLCIDPEASSSLLQNPSKQFPKAITIGDKVNCLPKLACENLLLIYRDKKREKWSTSQDVIVVITNMNSFVW